MRAMIGRWLRAAAAVLDPGGELRVSSWSFTLEGTGGVVFRDDGRGCPLLYRPSSYELAWSQRGAVIGGWRQSGEAGEEPPGVRLEPVVAGRCLPHGRDGCRACVW